MSAETLRRAAALMRDRATHPDVSASPWVASPHGDVHDDGALWVCDSQSGETAEHIASWSPAVALDVADLLDLAAAHEKREGDECGQGYGSDGTYGYIDPSCSVCGTPDEYAEPWPCAYATRGLAVARTYLGEDA